MLLAIMLLAMFQKYIVRNQNFNQAASKQLFQSICVTHTKFLKHSKPASQTLEMEIPKKHAAKDAGDEVFVK